MKKTILFFKVFINCVLGIIKYVIYFTSFLVPRNKNKFVFNSHSGQFADNAKYLYLYLLSYQKDIFCYWVATNKSVLNFLKKNGYPVCYKYSLQGMYHIATAKFWFFSGLSHDLCFWLSGGAIKTNLWHGVPIKSSEYSLLINQPKSIVSKFKNMLCKNLYPHNLLGSDWILTTSDIFIKYFKGSLNITKKQCINFSYPRNFVINFIPEWFNDNLLSPLVNLNKIIFNANSVYICLLLEILKRTISPISLMKI